MTGPHVRQLTTLLGAALDITVDAHPNAADQVERAMLDEASRLEGIFNRLDPTSEFSVWRTGCGHENPSADLARVLGAAERFWAFSSGAFHPGAGRLADRWRAAQETGIVPSRAQMRTLASDLQLPFTAVEGPVRRTGDCSCVEVDAIARGHILDTLVDEGWRLGLASSITASSGTEVVHRGKGAVTIRLSDAFRSDPEHAVVVQLSNAAFSRSEHPFSGYQVGRRRFRSVIDPQTGWPSETIAAVAALAADAMTAGAVATVVGVGQNGRRGILPGSAWLAVHADGSVHASENWPDASESPS